MLRNDRGAELRLIFNTIRPRQDINSIYYKSYKRFDIVTKDRIEDKYNCEKTYVSVTNLVNVIATAKRIKHRNIIKAKEKPTLERICWRRKSQTVRSDKYDFKIQPRWVRFTTAKAVKDGLGIIDLEITHGNNRCWYIFRCFTVRCYYR